VNGDFTRIFTERLTLRAWDPGDRSALTKILGDGDVMAYSDAGVLSTAQIEAWLTKQIAAPRSWAIDANGHVLGYIKLAPARVPEGLVEVGFRLARACWGRGYATEALRALLTYLPDGETPVTAVVDPANKRSVRVLTGCGFDFVRPIMFESYDHPDHLYVCRPG